MRWHVRVAVAGAAIAVLAAVSTSSGVQPPDPVIGAAGDIACAPSSNIVTAKACQQKATSDLLVAAKPTAVLTLGDEQYDEGRISGFRKVYGPTWGRLLAITHPAPGNHEYSSGNADGYYSYFGKAAGSPSRPYYSFDVGSWHIVALNSECSAAGAVGTAHRKSAGWWQISPHTPTAARWPSGMRPASAREGTEATPRTRRSGMTSTEPARRSCSTDTIMPTSGSRRRHPQPSQIRSAGSVSSSWEQAARICDRSTLRGPTARSDR